MEQTILVISPQRWDHIKLSKHHFAETLEGLGHNVYFLDPPFTDGRKTTVRLIEGYQNLFSIQFSCKIPNLIRFHCKWLFNMLTKFEVTRMTRSLPHKIDLVWSFDAHYFSSLKIFGARKAILHVVDKIVLKRAREVAKSADLIVAVSKEILDGFVDLKPQHLLVNHGIGSCFTELARQTYIESPSRQNPKVGYSGNLTHSAINRTAMIAMISACPDVLFHFWGNDKVMAISDHDADMPVEKFLKKLRMAKNVTFHGVVEPERLAREYEGMNALLVCYRKTGGFECDNTHKILEYLASGVVVVSSPLTAYTGYSQLIPMSKSEDPEEMTSLLQETLNDLQAWNTPVLAKGRKQMALSNTYESQVDLILNTLNNS